MQSDQDITGGTRVRRPIPTSRQSARHRRLCSAIPAFPLSHRPGPQSHRPVPLSHRCRSQGRKATSTTALNSGYLLSSTNLSLTLSRSRRPRTPIDQTPYLTAGRLSTSRFAWLPSEVTRTAIAGSPGRMTRWSHSIRSPALYCSLSLTGCPVPASHTLEPLQRARQRSR
jgi:hypothetical protein